MKWCNTVYKMILRILLLALFSNLVVGDFNVPCRELEKDVKLKLSNILNGMPLTPEDYSILNAAINNLSVRGPVACVTMTPAEASQQVKRRNHMDTFSNLYNIVAKQKMKNCQEEYQHSSSGCEFQDKNINVPQHSSITNNEKLQFFSYLIHLREELRKLCSQSQNL